MALGLSVFPFLCRNFLVLVFVLLRFVVVPILSVRFTIFGKDTSKFSVLVSNSFFSFSYSIWSSSLGIVSNYDDDGYENIF